MIISEKALGYLFVILGAIWAFTSIYGSKKFIWVSAFTGLISGILVGITSDGFPRGILSGIFIGLFLAILSFSGLITRYFRESARTR